MNRRRGYSLVELLVVMTVGSAIMGVAATLLYTLFRAESAAQNQVHRCTVLGRLADQFRRDVHAASTHSSESLDAKTVGGVSDSDAKTVGGVSDGDALRLMSAAGRTVTYRVGPGTVIRTRQDGQAVRQRETFLLWPGMKASIEVLGDTRPAIVRLVIAPTAEAGERPAGKTIHIDAVLASDHRFAKLKRPSNEDEDSDG